MKIVFWSHEKGRAGTTTNLAAVSVMLALGQNKQSLLLENHYHTTNLETMLVKNQPEVLRERESYYTQKGMDYLMRHMGKEQNIKGLIQQAALPLLHNHIRYLPQSPIVNKEVFAYQLQQALFPMLGYLEEMADYISIDAEADGNVSTAMVLSQADMVVVNLSQNPHAFEKFFRNYTSLQSKAVYIIGKYQADNEYTLDKILREYPIKKERISTIPYNRDFANALSQGKIISFLARNYRCGNFHENYPLIKECKNCAKMILEQEKKINPHFAD